MGEEVLTRLMSMTNVVCHANMDNLINVMVSGLVKCKYCSIFYQNKVLQYASVGVMSLTKICVHKYRYGNFCA